MLLPDAVARAVPDWLQALRDHADAPPCRPRVPLIAGAGAAASVVGSVEPDFLDQIALPGNIDKGFALLKKEHSAENNRCTGWLLNGDVTTSLNLVATALRAAGLAGAWRDEQLAVCNAQGRRLGTVERAAVRSLGIATLAVHLVGQAPDGRFWVQQRAFDKPNDPGKWDTLMGGMVSASDTVEAALQRETWEEAGLHIAELQNLCHGGRQSNCRPSGDGAAGYMQEFIEWYVATVPDSLTPINQDGEVAQFALMDKAQLLVAMQRGDFTTEAALIMASVLGLTTS